MMSLCLSVQPSIQHLSQHLLHTASLYLHHMCPDDGPWIVTLTYFSRSHAYVTYIVSWTFMPSDSSFLLSLYLLFFSESLFKQDCLCQILETIHQTLLKIATDKRTDKIEIAVQFVSKATVSLFSSMKVYHISFNH